MIFLSLIFVLLKAENELSGISDDNHYGDFDELETDSISVMLAPAGSR